MTDKGWAFETRIPFFKRLFGETFWKSLFEKVFSKKSFSTLCYKMVLTSFFYKYMDPVNRAEVNWTRFYWFHFCWSWYYWSSSVFSHPVFTDSSFLYFWNIEKIFAFLKISVLVSRWFRVERILWKWGEREGREWGREGERGVGKSVYSFFEAK